MDFPYGETVTRLRPGLEPDPYSGEDVASDTETPYSLDIPGCAFDPGGSSEPTEVGRSAIITRPAVYAPAGADIEAGDSLVVRGVTYMVEGNPAEYVSPFTGWAPGLVVTLVGVEG